MNIQKEIHKIAKEISASYGYILVRREPNGRFKTERFPNLDRLRAAVKRLGVKETGVENSPYVRPELRGQPRFDKLLGPMWDGTNGVRYEDQATYNILST